MQIDLTPFTLRITEDSAKQLVNSLQLTVICTIGLLREGECILCLACTFRDYYFLRKCKRNVQRILYSEKEESGCMRLRIITSAIRHK